MKKNILFDQALAEDLNEKVKKIAGHLFLFCDYEPEICSVFSTDAKFLLGVLNLYRLTIDASIVNKLGTVANSAYSARLKNIFARRIKPIVDESQMLRAVFAHNQGRWNRGAGRAFDYQQWVRAHIRKEKIEEVEDYTILLRAISDNADQLVSNLEMFMEEASKCDREKIVPVWQTLLLKFYEKNQGKEMVQSQMEEVYCALLAETGKMAATRRPLRREIAEWIKNRYLSEFLTAKKRLSSLIDRKEIRNPGTIQNIQEKIDEMEKSILDIQKYIGSRCAKQASELQLYDYLNVYVSDLLDRFKDRLKDLKDGDSMLPHGILQEILVNDMKNIPLP